MPDKFEISPTCPTNLTCEHVGECMALYFLRRELATNLPRKSEAIRASVDRAKCTDPEFLKALEAACEFLETDKQQTS